MKPPDLYLRLATLGDVAVLAAMNKRLIDDEGSNNRSPVAELEERMRRWLSENWSAVLITVDGTVIGYALYQLRRRENDESQQYVYLRQFFIEPSHRRQGIGRAGFEKLVDEFIPPDASITLEVLETNPDGREFWQAVGFRPYCTTMTIEPSVRTP